MANGEALDSPKKKGKKLFSVFGKRSSKVEQQQKQNSIGTAGSYGKDHESTPQDSTSNKRVSVTTYGSEHKKKSVVVIDPATDPFLRKFARSRHRNSTEKPASSSTISREVVTDRELPMQANKEPQEKTEETKVTENDEKPEEGLVAAPGETSEQDSSEAEEEEVEGGTVEPEQDVETAEEEEPKKAEEENAEAEQAAEKTEGENAEGTEQAAEKTEGENAEGTEQGVETAEAPLAGPEKSEKSKNTKLSVVASLAQNFVAIEKRNKELNERHRVKHSTAHKLPSPKPEKKVVSPPPAPPLDRSEGEVETPTATPVRALKKEFSMQVKQHKNHQEEMTVKNSTAAKFKNQVTATSSAVAAVKAFKLGMFSKQKEESSQPRSSSILDSIPATVDEE